MNTTVLFESFLETTPSDSIYFLNIVFEIELSSRRELQVIITEGYFEASKFRCSEKVIVQVARSPRKSLGHLSPEGREYLEP